VSAYIKCIPKFVAKFAVPSSINPHLSGETLRPLSSQQHLSRPRLRQMLVRAFTRELTAAGCVVGVELMGGGGRRALVSSPNAAVSLVRLRLTQLGHVSPVRSADNGLRT
jgi:hypothetical protein